MPLCTACTHCTQDSLVVIEIRVIKCYLECHLAHKDGSKDVVGDGEEDSFLDRQTGGGREKYSVTNRR